MIPMSRLLRKTKAVVSPGMKAGETREEYQLRYMQWWVKNHGEKLKTTVAVESMDTMGEIADAYGVELEQEDDEGGAEPTAITGEDYFTAFHKAKEVSPKKPGATRGTVDQ